MRATVALSVAAFFVMAAAGFLTGVQASDHDDGETDVKARSLNLTDHYAYRDPSDSSTLVLQMNVNPRSLPGQEYFFSTQAKYDFHVLGISDKLTRPTGETALGAHYVFRFTFGAPDSSGVQSSLLTVLRGTTAEVTDFTVQALASGVSSTTNLVNSAAGSLTLGTVVVNLRTVTFFAGLREDTFVFDVQRFFQVRDFLHRTFIVGDGTASLAANCLGGAYAAASGVAANEQDPVNLFNADDCAEDFTKNYNVLAIVMSLPVAAIDPGPGPGGAFDTWSTIAIPE